MKSFTTYSLIKLGFRTRKPDPILAFFHPSSAPRKPPLPIKPDVDYHPDAEREPQAPHFTHMWLDEFRNIGNIKNPLASPMESGA